MSERRDRLAEATVRVEKIIWIPGAVATGDIPEDMKDAIVDDLYGADNAQVIEKLPKLLDLLTGDEEPDEDWIVEVLYRETGFLVQLARPVPSRFTGTSHSFSWGHYATKWVYVDDMDELVAIAEKFSDEVVERARAREMVGVRA